MRPPSLLLFIFCLLVSFLYAGIEAGLLSLNRARLRSRVHQGDRAAIRLNRLLAHPARLLATVLLVTNFADVAALVLITNALFRRYGGPGCLLAGALMLPVYLLGVQLLPKSLFRRFPYRALAALAGLLEVTSQALAPLLAVGGWAGRRGWLAAAGRAEEGGGRRGSLFSAREEFKALAAEGERTGALTPAEHGMIDNVIDFSLVPAREVMQPPPAPLRRRPGLTVADLRAEAIARRLDSLPVADEAGSELAALIDLFTLLFERNGERDAAVYLRRPPLVVAPDDPALRVLRRLRAARLPAAAVLDADGRFVGIVRTADLVQRLVRQPPGGGVPTRS